MSPTRCFFGTNFAVPWYRTVSAANDLDIQLVGTRPKR